MLEYTQALALLLAKTPPKKTETVALADSLGQVLSGRIQADLDLPPSTNPLWMGMLFAIGICVAGRLDYASPALFRPADPPPPG